MSATMIEVEHAKANAQGWLESIREMVGNLDRETAATTFAETLDRSDCIRLLDYDYDNGDWEQCDDSVENMRELIVEKITDGDDVDGFEFNEESARETIQESVLSVEVRSDWYTLDADEDARKPSEFCILLSTGGPALRLIGELDEHGQPSRAWLEYQDWGTPWTHYYEQGAGDVLLEFASQFYFGG